MKINHFIVCLLLAMALFGFLNSSLASQERSQVKVVPRIDDEAAYTERNTEEINGNKLEIDKNNNEAVYSQNFWMLLFGAYLFLLIFNLSFEFGKKKKLQWFWEAVFTFLAVYVWDNLDSSRSNTWFPAVILESGIIIYGFYFYFFSKKSLTG
ncbi:MAG: hypothetical protein WC906_01450 [Parcubacteria group bacterium]|jgi:hypothetical protein